MARKPARDITKDLKKTAADARLQLMAVVGATDLAAERVRDAADKARASAKDFDIKDIQKDLEKVQSRIDKAQKDLLKQVNKRVKDLQDGPANAFGNSLTLASKAQAQVEEPAERGEQVVARIRKQQPTQELKHQVETTVAAGKGAVTTARKAAAEAEKAAEAAIKTGVKEAREVAAKVAETVEKDAKVVRGAAKKVAATVQADSKETAAVVKASAARTRSAAAKTTSTAQAGAKRTTARAKATTTGVRKTATRARTATTEAAKKVGD